jgi:hypothetical protein
MLVVAASPRLTRRCALGGEASLAVALVHAKHEGEQRKEDTIAAAAAAALV